MLLRIASDDSNHILGVRQNTMRGFTISAAGQRISVGGVWILYSVLLGPLSLSSFAGEVPRLEHGLWVWKSATVFEAPRGVETLWEFCKSEGINEVYVSISGRSEASEEGELAHLIALLHRSDIQVEALLSSTDADEPGKHRERLLNRVREIMQFIRWDSPRRGAATTAGEQRRREPSIPARPRRCFSRGARVGRAGRDDGERRHTE
jgi:hypothetical protein